MRLVLLKIVFIVFCIPLCVFNLLSYWDEMSRNGISVSKGALKQEFSDFWIELWGFLRK